MTNTWCGGTRWQLRREEEREALPAGATIVDRVFAAIDEHGRYTHGWYERARSCGGVGRRIARRARPDGDLDVVVERILANGRREQIAYITHHNQAWVDGVLVVSEGCAPHEL